VISASSQIVWKEYACILVKLGSTTILKWNTNIQQNYISCNLKYTLLMKTAVTGIYSSGVVFAFFEG
jgi:hypothetical protein